MAASDAGPASHGRLNSSDVRWVATHIVSYWVPDPKRQNTLPNPPRKILHSVSLRSKKSGNPSFVFSIPNGCSVSLLVPFQKNINLSGSMWCIYCYAQVLFGVNGGIYLVIGSGI